MYNFIENNKKEKLLIFNTFSFSYGGDTRIRTGDRDFADLCLTTWLCRHKNKYGAGNENRTRD